MNKKNILKIWFDKTFKKVVKVDNIDKIKQLMKEKQVVLKDLQESYYESKGELKTLQDKIKGVDIYNCKKLTSSGVKTVKKQKLQKTKGVFMAAEYSQRNEQENMNGRKTA